MNNFFTQTFSKNVVAREELILDVDGREAHVVNVHLDGGRRLQLTIEGDELVIRGTTHFGERLIVRPSVSNQITVTTEDPK